MVVSPPRRRVSLAYGGSLRQGVDVQGAVTAAREWTSYGVEVDGAQAGLGYTGEWFDAEVEAQYLRARWYAISVGRFIAQDRVPGNVQVPQSFNPYHYAFNNPVNRTDPSGLYPPPPPPLPPASGGGPGDRFSSPTMEFALGWVKGHAGDFIRYANEYGIPAELPAGLLAAEIDLDHTLPGRTLDDMARMANLMRQFSCFWPSYLPMPMLVSMGLVGSETYWEVVSTTDTYKVFGKDLGDVVSGDSASHHATYVIVEEYMTENYGKPLPYGTEKSAYLPWLLTDQGSIEFTARMARMLADYRKGSKSPHGREDLSLDDMAQIWGAWRAGIYGVTCFRGPNLCGFRDLGYFQDKPNLGEEAQLAYPHFEYCREYFTSKNKHPK